MHSRKLPFKTYLESSIQDIDGNYHLKKIDNIVKSM